MHSIQELSVEQLLIDYNLDRVLDLSSQASKIFPGNAQIREMLDTILKIADNGHIFLSSNQATKGAIFLKKYLENNKNNENYDWCFINNFDEPNNPKLLRLPAGSGKCFKEAIENGVKNTLEEIRKYLNSKEVRGIGKKIKSEVVEESEKLIDDLKKAAKQMNFSTHISDKGIYFIPIINGKKISEDDYDKLNVEEQEVIIDDLNKMEKQSIDIMKKIKKLKKEGKNRIEYFNKKLISECISKNFEEIRASFCADKDVVYYIDQVLQKLEEKLSLQNEVLDIDEEKHTFCVNLVKSTENDSAPVLCISKISYYELFGKIEYISDSSNYISDFSLIKPGFIHSANGGFLILDALDVLSSKFIWDKLKKTLGENKITFENIREQLGALPIKTIEPDDMPLNMKVILVGEEQLYQTLYEYDKEFKEIFSYHLKLEDEIDSNEENISEIIAYFRDETMSEMAIKRLIDYSILKTGHRRKMSTEITELERIINMGRFFAKEEGVSKVDIKHIIKAENEYKKYNSHYEKILKELFIKEQILLNVSGKIVGQINALSICKYVDYQIAYPIRVTAISYAGEDGIISIEKENKLSGKIFSKGISIIKSYISQLLAKEKPLSVNCLLCFEQVYGDIEGDSASCAEVFSILSALTNRPINQGFGVTGSIDQFGNVQPIGCVSNKIEGFFNVCKLKGLTGKQGVIIPIQNVDEICLNEEIKESILKKEFHIYPISKIDEGIPILMDTTLETIREEILITKIQKNELGEAQITT